jgi:hypothetical protein
VKGWREEDSAQIHGVTSARRALALLVSNLHLGRKLRAPTAALLKALRDELSEDAKQGMLWDGERLDAEGFAERLRQARKRWKRVMARPLPLSRKRAAEKERRPPLAPVVPPMPGSERAG